MTIDKQPEALRLADLLDEKWHRWKDDPTDELKAAAELRRLHAENEELLEALKTLTAYLGKTATHTSDLEAVWDAEKVIGKATGETK